MADLTAGQTDRLNNDMPLFRELNVGTRISDLEKKFSQYPSAGSRSSLPNMRGGQWHPYPKLQQTMPHEPPCGQPPECIQLIDPTLRRCSKRNRSKLICARYSPWYVNW